MSALPILLPVTLLGFAVLAALAGVWRWQAAQVVALVGTAAGFALGVVGLVSAVRHGPLRHELGGWPPPIGIEYVLDPLSAFMALLVTFIGFLVIVYPVRAGFGDEPAGGAPLYALALLLLTGLLGVVVSGDLFNLFVFLEVYAIATYALVSLGGDRALFASFRYLILGTAGSGFYLLGVGFLYFMTGSLNMADVAGQLPPIAESPTVIAALVLIVVGLGVKMALFPLHVWLPDAHSYAPPAVAALLAAVQVKVGAYALIRILLEVFPREIVVGLPVTTLLAWFGTAGIIVGSVMAIAQTDFKRLLAWSTVAQLGFIGLGIGLASPLGLIGALLHVLNHAFMKSCLFLVAGGIYDQTGVRMIPAFAGLGRRMPITMASFTIAAVAMVGVPPTAGFFSKWYLLRASVDAGEWTFAVVLVVSSLLTAFYFLRVIEQVFTADPVNPAIAEAEEPPGRVLAPVLALAAGIIAFGLGNAAVVGFALEPVAEQLFPGG